MVNSGFLLWWYQGFNLGTKSVRGQCFTTELCPAGWQFWTQTVLHLTIHRFILSISILYFMSPNVQLPFLFYSNYSLKSPQSVQFHPLNLLINFMCGLLNLLLFPLPQCGLAVSGHSKRGKSYRVALQIKSGRGSSLVKLGQTRHTYMSTE